MVAGRGVRAEESSPKVEPGSSGEAGDLSVAVAVEVGGVVPLCRHFEYTTKLFADR